MILDAEEAVIDYLTDNMVALVGSGNVSVDIFRESFPDDAGATCISVYAEVSDSDPDVSELMPVAVRIICRSDKPSSAFKLMQNADLLLDKLVRKSFNADVECKLCRRNAGPDNFIGPSNGLYHETALYSMVLMGL